MVRQKNPTKSNSKKKTHLIILIIIIVLISISITHVVDTVYYRIDINSISTKESKYRTAYQESSNDFKYLIGLDKQTINCYKLQNTNDSKLCQQHNHLILNLKPI